MDKNMKIEFCDKCNFHHLKPLPSEKELEEYYNNKYYQKAAGAQLLENRAQHPIEEEHLLFKYQEKLDLIEENSQIHTILDIGCGSGRFMEFMKNNGWDAYGIELSKTEIKKGIKKKLKIIEGSVHNIEEIYPKKRFGAIYLSNVLEHLREPKLILKKIKNILHDDGIIFIEVPNDFSPFQLALKDEIDKPNYWICTPDHLNYFNIDTLKKLLQNCGFLPTYHTSSFPIELFLLMGDDYTNNPELGKKVYLKIAQYELKLYKSGYNNLRRKINEELSKLNVGRNLTVIAKKNRN